MQQDFPANDSEILPGLAALDPALSSCPAPNLLASGLANGNWDGLRNQGYQILPDASVGDGWSARRQWSSTLVGQAAGVTATFSGGTRVYARWRYKQDATFNNAGTHNVVKFIRPGWWGGPGLLQVSGDRFRWIYEQLNRNATYYQNVGTEIKPSSLRGSWHWFEVMNDITTSGALRMKLWIDGQLKMDYLVAKPNQSMTIGIVEIGGEFQAPVPAGTDWYDDIGVSTNCVGIPNAVLTSERLAVSSVTLTPTTASLYLGQQTALGVVVRDQNGTAVSDRPVTWVSSDTSVASVANGIVSSRRLGSATITATSETKSATATVSVVAVPVATVTVSPTNPALLAGAATQLTATTRDSAGTALSGRVVAWTSNQPSVATVSSSGVVTAVAAGSALISATSETKSGTATVSVTVPAPTVVAVASVILSPTTFSVNAGATTTLTAVTKDASGTNLTGRVIAWATSNAAIATVSQNGVVTGVAAGSATISASSEGKTGQSSVTVTAPATVPTGSGVLSGTVADVSSLPVGGGTVEVLSGTTVVQTASVSASGSYSITTLAAGTYGVRLQPPMTHSMGPSEPAQRSVTIQSGQTTPATVSFVVQRALWSDDFQAYTTSSLLAGCGQYTGNIPAGGFFSGSGHDMGCTGTNAITMDPSGGPGGTSRAIRYDWTAKPSYSPLTTYCASETTINLAPRFYPSPSFSPSDTLWIRFSSKESAGFQHGAPSCGSTAGLAYKFFLVLIEKAGAFGRFGTYLFPRTTGSATDATLGVDMTDQTNRASSGSTSGPIGAGYNGVYRTYHIQIFNLGTTSTTFRVYMNGVKISELVGPIFPGTAVGGSGWALTLALGANINNGSEQAQSRWFRELAIYKTRPSMRPLPP